VFLCKQNSIVLEVVESTIMPEGARGWP